MISYFKYIDPDENKNLLLIEEFGNTIATIDLSSYTEKRIKKYITEHREEILKIAGTSQKEEVEKLQKESLELKGKVQEQQKIMNQLRKGYDFWILYNKRVLLNPIKTFLKEEFLNNLLKKKYSEIKKFVEVFKTDRLNQEDNRNSQNQITNSEETTAKESIRRLLINSGALEIKDIINSLKDIPEGTIRKSLERERDKLFKINPEGKWEVR